MKELLKKRNEAASDAYGFIEKLLVSPEDQPLADPKNNSLLSKHLMLTLEGLFDAGVNALTNK